MKKIKFMTSLMSFLLMSVFTFGQEITVAPSQELECSASQVDEYVLAVHDFQKALLNVSGIALIINDDGSYTNGMPVLSQMTESEFLDFLEYVGLTEKYQTMTNLAIGLNANSACSAYLSEKYLVSRAKVLLSREYGVDPNVAARFWDTCSWKAIRAVGLSAGAIAAGCATGVGCAGAALIAVIEYTDFCMQCC